MFMSRTFFSALFQEANAGASGEAFTDNRAAILQQAHSWSFSKVSDFVE
jgi:hypothetical protein